MIGMPGDGTPFRATDKQPARRLGGATGRGFLPGRSGNPAGRAKGIEALARQHTEAAIQALVKALDSPKERVPAAVALLNRGWGLPRTIETNDPASPLLLHHAAALLVSAEIVARMEQQTTINARAETERPETTTRDLLAAPIPTE
jgi:hypothetical protein